MSTPFMAEIKIISFNYAPKGWALCNGQLLPINQNQALFSLLGTTFGGDGRVNFGLPNLQGRVPLHMGQGLVLGQRTGEESHTLLSQELAPHFHALTASQAAATDPIPSATVGLAEPIAAVGNLYGSDAVPGTAAPLATQAITPSVGGGQAHENRQPYLTLNFVIALQGAFPSRN